MSAVEAPKEAPKLEPVKAAKLSRKPYVGATVVFYPAQHAKIAEKYGLKAYPGIVTNVYENSRVDLVFVTPGPVWSEASVPPSMRRAGKTYDAGVAFSDEPKMECWGWPKG